MLRLVLLVAGALPVIVAINTGILVAQPARYWLGVGLGGLLVVMLAWFFVRTRDRLDDLLERLGREQAAHLDGLSDKHLEIAIAGSAALSLFLELAVIRWQGTVWEYFAFYKNLGLLSCFAGLGLGYALAKRERLPLVLTVPLLACQILLFIGLRHGSEDLRVSLSRLPFQEQQTMGVWAATRLPQYVSSYALIVVTFLLTALAFLPVGQLCGRAMERMTPLRAYRLNLLGSMVGVGLMLLASMLWTPPVVWFLAVFAGLLAFQVFRPRALGLAAFSAIFAIGVLAWPTTVGSAKVYSPYQLLEKRTDIDGSLVIDAAGHYHQRVPDLSPARQTISPIARQIARYYDFPYRVRVPPPERVAVVGAGTGNDVAAALRAGVRAVDAIEIDPAIVDMGRDHHPEKPYFDPRVQILIDDARSFLRSTPERYDLIVYGLLDSHTLLSHASPVRIDSYVYTVEGLREARARLTDQGYLSLSFAIMSPSIATKIYRMIREAFDGKPPICVLSGYDGSVIFLQSKHGDLVLPPDLLERSRFREVTAQLAASQLPVDMSTDDWPFFYMPARVYPVSYLLVIGILLVLSILFFANFISERPQGRQLPFFFLGAGFMLVETKGITEMGLAFGNTWQVTGLMIAGVLVMAFIANQTVERFGIKRALVPYLFLLASLVVGIAVARAGGLPSTPLGKLATVTLLTCPLFFSGIVFSTLLARTTALAGAMAFNLLGAMCGGLLEYNSMYFGFRFLYWLAIALYLLAALTTGLSRERHATLA